MNTFLDWLLSSVHSVDWLLRDVVTALAIACETTLGLGLIVPGDTMAVVAGTGVGNAIDFIGLYAFVLFGSFVGESVGFWIGRKLGGKIRTSWLGRKIGEKNWELADLFVESRGGIAVALSRFLPVLHSLVPVVSGMTRMRYRDFIRWVMAACFIWAGLYLSVGWALHNSYDMWLGRLKYGSEIFVAIIAVVIVVISLVKKRLEKTAESMIEAEQAREAIAETEKSEGLE
jgi:membrane-associated protein